MPAASDECRAAGRSIGPGTALIRFAAEGNATRAEGLGVWSGCIEMPWEWHQEHRRGNEMIATDQDTQSCQLAARRSVRSNSLRRDFPMSIEPNMSTHLHGALEGRLQNMDKQREIDLYYELLNSGHSVGEILNAVGPPRSKSKHADTATSDHPRSERDGVTNVASEAASVDAARANALCPPGLGVAEEAEICRTDEPRVTQSPSLNQLGSDDGERAPW